LRLWDATRWVAWAAFVVCTTACLSTTDRRKRWGFLDASGLFLLWALSDAPTSVLTALVVSQAMALSLGALAPPSQRVRGVWAVKLSVALLLPGWWVLSLSGGVGIFKGASWVWAAFLWLTFVVLRTAQPLSSEEATSAGSEKGFLMVWLAALGVWGLALSLG